MTRQDHNLIAETLNVTMEAFNFHGKYAQAEGVARASAALADALSKNPQFNINTFRVACGLFPITTSHERVPS